MTTAVTKNSDVIANGPFGPHPPPLCIIFYYNLYTLYTGFDPEEHIYIFQIYIFIFVIYYQKSIEIIY